jgi:hypothetical protein
VGDDLHGYFHMVDPILVIVNFHMRAVKIEAVAIDVDYGHSVVTMPKVILVAGYEVVAMN